MGGHCSLGAGVRDPLSVPLPEGSRPIDPLTRICLAVQQRWDEWDAATRLENIFKTKMRVLTYVYENNGTNNYSIPRSGTSHQGERPTLPITRLAPMGNVHWPPVVIRAENGATTAAAATTSPNTV